MYKHHRKVRRLHTGQHQTHRRTFRVTLLYCSNQLHLLDSAANPRLALP